MKNYMFIILAAWILYTCRQPTGNDKGYTSPRDYKWKEYIIYQPDYDATTMVAVWGAATNDVYVAGDNSAVDNTIYHFDGKKWDWVDLKYSKGTIRSIFGFSKNNIYAASDASSYIKTAGHILHYDGDKWRVLDLKIGSLYGGVGIAPDDMWFGGAFGSLFHFDGSKVTDYSTADSFSFYSFGAFASDDVYALAYGRINYVDYNYFLHWDGISWKIREKAPDYQSDFGYYMTRIDSSLYTVNGGLVSRYNLKDRKWKVIYASVGVRLYGIEGNSEDNVFAVGTNNTVLHYNGTNWYEYHNLPSTGVEFGRVWTDGQQVFAVGRKNGKTHILQGK